MTSCAQELHERGYVVFEDVLEPMDVARLRDEILSIVERLGPPALHSEQVQEIGEGASITPAGVAIRRLLRRRPDLCPYYLLPPVRALLTQALGEDMRLEDAGVMVSDAARPFFTWHTHIDGEDEGVRYRARRWPRLDGIGRVLTLLYLDDIDRGAGPLHVLPRRVGDPTEPVAPLEATDWPGQVVLGPRAGTLVAFDQCTWHAALPRTRPGLRVIAGAFFAARSTPPAPWVDEGPMIR